MKYDVVVIGSGMSGLISAAKAVSRNRTTLVITKGQGILPLTSGCLDFWGYQLDNPKVVASNPYEEINKLVQLRPEHPYAKVIDVLAESTNFLQEILTASGCPLAGNIYENRSVLTALGTERIAALIPPSMVIESEQKIKKVIAVGFKNYPDFFPQMFLDNLQSSLFSGAEKIPLIIDLGVKEVLRSSHLSVLLEQEDVLSQVINKIKTILNDQCAINEKIDRSILLAFPAVLGQNLNRSVYNRLCDTLNVQVIEVPGLPPSIPGQRLQQALTVHLKQQGAEFRYNANVTNFTIADGKIDSVHVLDSSNSTHIIKAESIILATGSFLGGGLTAKKDAIIEPVFSLPVITLQSHDDNSHFLSIEGQKVLGAGLEVDEQLRPITGISNLYAAGSILAYSNYASEKSGLGVALTTGYKAGSMA